MDLRFEMLSIRVPRPFHERLNRSPSKHHRDDGST